MADRERLLLSCHSLGKIATVNDAAISPPFLEQSVIDAMARQGGREGLRGRTAAMRRLSAIYYRNLSSSALRRLRLAAHCIWRCSQGPKPPVSPEHGDTVEPGRITDQHPPPFGEDGVVRGVPGDVKSVGDPSDGELLDHERLQRPTERRLRKLAPRRRGRRGVLPPDMTATAAGVPADNHVQRGGPPAERCVREPPHDRVARDASATAPPAPVVVRDDPTRDHGAIGLETLPDRAQSEPVEAGESRQVRGSEGSVGHVEVFRMGSVRTSILRETLTHLQQRTPQRRTTPATPSTAKGPFGGGFWATESLKFARSTQSTELVASDECLEEHIDPSGLRIEWQTPEPH